MDPDGNEGSDEDSADRSFPMPALSAMQSTTHPAQQQQPLPLPPQLPIASSSSGGSSTLMLRSLLTGANVPVVASGAVAPGVVSQTTPVTLEPITASDPSLPPEEEDTGESRMVS